MYIPEVKEGKAPRGGGLRQWQVQMGRLLTKGDQQKKEVSCDYLLSCSGKTEIIL
jgi:hypothetical protein